MARQILEGPWEEVVRQGDCFAGKHVRVEVVENGPAATGDRPKVPFYATATPEERARRIIE